MTQQVYQFVKSLGLSGKVLDCGSRDVNGSVRDLFTDYTGIDQCSGKNVDRVMSTHDLSVFPAGSFDHVLCLEMLEHDAAFWDSFVEMKRVLKSGGRLVVTTRGIDFPLHEPPDYWRFTAQGLHLLFHDMLDVFVTGTTGDRGVFGYGTKT